MTATAVPAPTARIASRRREHVFYLGMALAVILVVFAGFARTYYLRPWFATDALRPLLHLHGVVFTAWVVLLLGQVTLVAGGRVGVHRRLGVAGRCLQPSPCSPHRSRVFPSESWKRGRLHSSA